ncbi:hypothetical protein C8R44DRAFT_827847 [Mycena epipterygia]|nr:hypothetical protein C8R44DRAFT_827847 [Mycena epipterygia]
MNKNLQKWEDRGWIGIPNRLPLQALAACLRGRQEITIFEKLDPSHESLPHTRATELARKGAEKDETESVNFSIRPCFQVRGAKIATLTQALAYQGIKELRETPTRNTTEENIALIQQALKTQSSEEPTPKKIWRSIRHKDISRQIKTFLWKAIHGAHRTGKYWKHIPECEHRMVCQSCGETESLQHILFECERPGQEQIWDLVKKLWAKKHDQLPALSMGGILGCGLSSFEKESKLKPSGVNRLYRIMISESAYLIWKLRNESVIGGKLHTTHEIHNRWVHLMNDQLETDCFLANEYVHRKNKIVSPSLVLGTWSRILQAEDKLPKNWLREPKVLVGIAKVSSRRSPPPD